MPRRPGFSLVEVSIAMGILAFVVLAVLGLLGAGMSSGRSAQSDTALTAAARFAATSLQTNGPLAGTNFWFSYDGLPLASSNGAHFQCAVSTNSPAASAPRLLGLRLVFFHPLAAREAARTTNVIHASTILAN